MALTVNFSGGIPPWLGAAVVVAALALTLFFYARNRGAGNARHLAYLTALRLFAVLLVSLLALKPLVTASIERTREGERIILVDTSGSMAVRDYPNLPGRLDSVKALLAPGSPSIAALSKRFKVEVDAFDSRPRGETSAASVSSLAPSGSATDVAAALSDAAERLKGRKDAGIILLSDGIETAAQPADYTGGVPVVSVGVGSRLSAEGTFKDLIVSSVEVLPAGQPVVSKGNLAQIAVSVEGLGLAGLVTPVQLKDAAGVVVAQDNVAVDAERGDQRVVLSFTPAEKGNFKYTVEIPPRPEETIRENNVQTLNITVTDPQIRVLYVEGTLRWEYRYVKRVLERDPNVRLLALVRLSERTFYQQGNVTDVELTGFPKDLDTLKRFNVIILGDLPASALSAQDMTNVRDAVRGGAGLVMLSGYNSFADGGYAGTPLADVLPVTLDAADGGQDKNAFVPALTDQGEVSPIFAGITDYFAGPGRRAAREIPALLGQTKIGAPKPGATVLAVNPLRSDAAGSLPVLVTQAYGSGRSAAFAADTTWQWWSTMKGLDLDSPFVRFWGQMARWLARREGEDETGKPGVTAYVDKAYYSLGDEVVLTAEVRGADGLLSDKAAVDAAVAGPEPTKIPMGTIAGSKGSYTGRLKPSQPGTYEIAVNASEGGAALGEAKAGFEVGVENVELRRIDLDEDYLRKVAAESGGTYMPLVEFPTWAAKERSAGEAETVVEVLNLRQTRVLYPLFLLFVVMVTVEWVWRKRIEMP